MTYRLNQDPLESFFGIIRAIGGLHDHPTALEFKFRLRNYLLGRNETILSQATNVLPSESANIFKDIDINLETTKSAVIESEIITSTMLKHLIEDKNSDDNCPNITVSYTELEHDGVENIAGYVA